MRNFRFRLLLASALLVGVRPASAEPDYYQPGIDPGVGFNLISWWNFGESGASIWEAAVESIHEAGFEEVSISPVRFVTLGTGAIAESSAQGPELSHIAAGIARAKSLGMRVTVNPFVEPQGFLMWRGQYDPAPATAEWTTFWEDYQEYLVDVAEVAEDNGADSMTVGTEYRAIVRNRGNNAQWNSVINAVDASFSGTLGYAANWDNYQNNNLQTAIWDHPAIDFIGIDAYFENLVTNSQADASGTYPNETFIAAMEDAWNDLLDEEILPYARDRKAGAGMPVEFTEIGYLPHNRTAVMPQRSSEPIDEAEQTMAFAGLMRALDGRSEEFLAAHVWTWGMPGTGDNLWDMGLDGEQQANNLMATQWLADFVATTLPDDADFDGDEDVDGQDLLQWQRYFGSEAELAVGDANHDGKVDSLDLAVWQAQYGTSGEEFRVVPEPSAFALALWIVIFGRCRRLLSRR